MKVYYWKGKLNFGDLLTPLLLKKFCKLNSEWATADKADLVMVGSILEHLPEGFKGIIAGTGKLHYHTKLKFPNAKILGVRGRFTANSLGLKGDYILGDAGLLANELVPLEDKIYNLGIVPHWSDTELEKDSRFTKYNPKIIRVSDDPLKVISEIGKCHKIVSSSLHGIITADAFNIPRRIEIAPSMTKYPDREGGLYKWRDYQSSLGIPLEIGGKAKAVNSNIITTRQHEIFDMLQEIKGIFKCYN